MYLHPEGRSFPLSSVLEGSHFTLNTAAVAGVFGGDAAVSAMGTVHFNTNRRWLGWYNCPGSYEIAGQYGRLAQLRLFRSVFPGPRKDPATLFELDGLKGPSFRGTYSGTVITETGHLAALLAKVCADLKGAEVDGRKTKPVDVTIVNLTHTPLFEKFLNSQDSHSHWLALMPISVSVATSIACGLARDWYILSMIVFGMLASGISCAVLGCGKLKFVHPKPADGCPAGDGILYSDTGIILLKGKEGAVNSITRGTFQLVFDKLTLGKLSISYGPTCVPIGICSLLLLIQFIVQLLLVPQGHVFGQTMFTVSLAASWGYNMWLSSIDKEMVQRNILNDDILEKPEVIKFTLGTRTSMTVFVLLASREDCTEQQPSSAGDSAKSEQCGNTEEGSQSCSKPAEVMSSDPIVSPDHLTCKVTSPDGSMSSHRTLSSGQPMSSGRAMSLGWTTLSDRTLIKEEDITTLWDILTILIPNETRVWRVWKNSIMHQLQVGRDLDFGLLRENLTSFADPEEKRLLSTLYSDAEDAYRAFCLHFRRGKCGRTAKAGDDKPSSPCSGSEGEVPSLGRPRGMERNASYRTGRTNTVPMVDLERRVVLPPSPSSNACHSKYVQASDLNV